MYSTYCVPGTVSHKLSVFITPKQSRHSILLKKRKKSTDNYNNISGKLKMLYCTVVLYFGSFHWADARFHRHLKLIFFFLPLKTHFIFLRESVFINSFHPVPLSLFKPPLILQRKKKHERHYCWRYQAFLPLLSRSA